MAIQDVLTPVDLVPGLSGQGRHDTVPPAGDSQPSSSEYQRALSRTLNDGGRRDQDTDNSANTKSGEGLAPAAGEDRPRASSESNQLSTDSDRSVSGSGESATENQSPTTPQAGDDVGRSEGSDIDSAASTESQTDVIEVGTVVPVAVTVIDNSPLKPPAELSELFTTGTGDEVPVELNAQEQALAEDLVIRPPNGLFESQQVPHQEQVGVESLPNGQSATQADGNAAPGDAPLFADTLQRQLAEGGADQPNSNTLRAETADADIIPVDSQSQPTQHAVVAETSTFDLHTNAGQRNSGQSSDNNRATDASVSQPSTTVTNAGQIAVSNGTSQQPTIVTANETHNLENDRGDQRSMTGGEAAEESRGTTLEYSSANDVTASVVQETESNRDTSVAVGTKSESNPDSMRLNDTSGTAPVAVTPTVSSTTIAPSDTALDVSSSGLSKVESEQLVERVANAVQSAPQNGQQLRVRLYPPHLGALQVEVTSHGGTLSVQMEVQTVAAQRALTENMSMLRDALASQGTVIDRVDVQLVETTPEEGRSDLTDEQQQNDQKQEQDAEGQAADENEEPQEAEGPENKQKPVSANAGIDELDIQV